MKKMYFKIHKTIKKRHVGTSGGSYSCSNAEGGDKGLRNMYLQKGWK